MFDLQILDIGDSFSYCNQRVTIVDWKCYTKSTWNEEYQLSIAATPIIKHADGTKQMLHESAWIHCTKS